MGIVHASTLTRGLLLGLLEFGEARSFSFEENCRLKLLIYGCFRLYPFGLFAAISILWASLADGCCSEFFSKTYCCFFVASKYVISFEWV